MIIKVGRYKFEYGRKEGEKKVDPLTLEDISDSKPKTTSLPNGKLLLKKPDYALMKVPRSQPIVEIMLKFTKNTRDKSRSFIIMYVNNTFVGYKSTAGAFFLPSFKKKEYIDILEGYEPKKSKKKVVKYKSVAKPLFDDF